MQARRRCLWDGGFLDRNEGIFYLKKGISSLAARKRVQLRVVETDMNEGERMLDVCVSVAKGNRVQETKWTVDFDREKRVKVSLRTAIDINQAIIVVPPYP